MHSDYVFLLTNEYV